MKTTRTISIILFLAFAALGWDATADVAQCKVCNQSDVACEQAPEGQEGRSSCYTEWHFVKRGYCSETCRVSLSAPPLGAFLLAERA